ncbi:Translation initiation factor IF-2, mitochondrial [Halotydeus destructor]|nr:Translation initiation factor IF-2, mitochondrial [Halotydeus destructor]
MRTTLPGTIHGKHPVADIWTGMTVKEVAATTKRSLDDVYEAMVLNDIDDILSVKDVRKVCQSLGFRCNLVKDPVDSVGFLVDAQTKIELKQRPGTILKPRPPVVTIMGHVDHGKTTLLDSLRKSEIVKQEHGGITQHIGAFVVSLNEPGKEVSLKAEKNIKNLVTFLDTPGHAAFSAMRERGANVTDIVVLVVAADDGVMNQTVESISYAKTAGVPIIVAINKMDKVKGSPEQLKILKQGLMAHGIVLEEDQGETQAVKVSGLTGLGLEELKEAILAQAETLSLKTYIDGDVEAAVVESQLHPHRGRLATLLIRTGTLKRGDVIVAGDHCWAKVRSMFDEWGNVVQMVGPGLPVQVIGWKDDNIPDAGDKVLQVESEKSAKEYVQEGLNKMKDEKANQDYDEAFKRLDEHQKEHKQALMAKRALGIRYKMRSKKDREKMIKEDPDAAKKINIILKADVSGSLEVLLDVLQNYPNHEEDVQVNVVHFGVGALTEKDVELATCFPNTFIYGFNLKTPSAIASKAKEAQVPIKTHNVIYHLVDDLKKEISDRLPLQDVELVVGEAAVLQEFMINEKNKKVSVAGCRCSKGVLKKAGTQFRLERGGNVLVDGLKISSMRHLKDEVDSIKNNVECGLRFDFPENSPVINFQNQDKLICYETKKVSQVTRWSPEGF